MYQLIKAKKKQYYGSYDYVFTEFKAFYDIACILTMPLSGRYYIAVESESVDDIKEFIKQQERYDSLVVDIYTTEAVIDYIVMRDTHVSAAANQSDFDVLKKIVADNGILIDKHALLILYNSINHDVDSMTDAVALLKENTTPDKLITRRDLEKLFILNLVVYPRQVLIAYLRMDRWRESKLEKCLSSISDEIVTNAMIKNIKLLLEQKITYFKTGKGNNLIKMLNTRNILIMYRVLVLERRRINDPTILLDLYERGLSCYDLINEGRS